MIFTSQLAELEDLKFPPSEEGEMEADRRNYFKVCVCVTSIKTKFCEVQHER